MNELDAIFAWLSSTLKGDATLRATMARRWFRNLAPEIDPETRNPITYPLGVYSKSAGRDTRGVGQARLLTVALIDVRIVSRAGTDVSSAVARVDALLDVPSQAEPVASVTVDSLTYSIHGCSRRDPLSFATLEAAVHYEHAGGTYEITVSR